MSSIEDTIKNFSRQKVMIIGDAGLDEYIFGTVDRISSEAPVPILRIRERKRVPGCAANTANNIASLGGKAYIIGAIGNDLSGRYLKEIMASKEIDYSGMITCDNFPTITKTRILGTSGASPQQIARLDDEETISGHEDKIIEYISEIMPKIDIVIVSDYRKGTMNKRVAESLKEIAAKYGKKIIVDTKPENVELYSGVFMLKPNIAEAQKMTGIHIMDDYSAIQAGRNIQERYDTNVLLTRSAQGMDVFYKDKHEHIPVKTVTISDVSGAGDSVISTTGLCLSQGKTLVESARIASYVAAIVVGKLGTSTANQQEVIAYKKNNG
jgi:rfaE bifunctional protein kinase chain/domain